jgi:hypothetical protein
VQDNDAIGAWKTMATNTYMMSGKVLGKTEEERDIGVSKTKSLKPSIRCAKAAKTDSIVLGQICLTSTSEIETRGIGST